VTCDISPRQIVNSFIGVTKFTINKILVKIFGAVSKDSFYECFGIDTACRPVYSYTSGQIR